nr:uncharacterized protein LOC109158616 [Ipomoea trifida]
MIGDLTRFGDPGSPCNNNKEIREPLVLSGHSSGETFGFLFVLTAKLDHRLDLWFFSAGTVASTGDLCFVGEYKHACVFLGGIFVLRPLLCKLDCRKLFPSKLTLNDLIQFAMPSFSSMLDNDILISYIESAVIRGGEFWWLGLRALYFAITLLFWFFGLIPMFGTSMAMVLLLHYLDRNTTPLHRHRSSDKGKQQLIQNAIKKPLQQRKWV